MGSAKTTVTPADPWGSWLSEGRVRGASADQRRRMRKSLERVRDQVLQRAALRPGHTVLDLGAGEGLLALRARKKVTNSGVVVALDISTSALTACVAKARRTRNPTAPLLPIAGDALRLPFASQTFDAVVARSVLMHVDDRQQATSEIARVLRPGGTASVFEAIAAVGLRGRDADEQEIAAVLPDYARVRRHAWNRETSPMLGFDERDLVGWFVAAGFRGVRMEYQETHVNGARATTRDEVARTLSMRPNPSALSHEEAAGEVLGDGSGAYLDALTQLMVARGRRAHHGLVLLHATT